MTTRNFLRDAKIHEVIGAAFGWFWILGSAAGLIWLFGAIFGDWSWLLSGGLLIGSQFTKAVSRYYYRAGQQAIADGLAAGQIYMDAGNKARATEPDPG